MARLSRVAVAAGIVVGAAEVPLGCTCGAAACCCARPRGYARVCQSIAGGCSFARPPPRHATTSLRPHALAIHPSPPLVPPQILLTNANKYSKGLLSEILDFVMGQGLIPADGEVWKVRRRMVVPSLHKKYIAAMTEMFGECALLGAESLNAAADVSGRQAP